MEIPLIQIGNSKIIPLTKSILERYNITDKVAFLFEEDFFILKPVQSIREGWEKSFSDMAQNNDDRLLMEVF